MNGGDVPDGMAETIQEYLDTHHEFLSWLGVTIEELDGDRAVMSVPYDEKLTNVSPGGDDESGESLASMHGGVAATLVDSVGGLALRPHLEDPFEGDMATINLDVNYLRPATDDLIATAEPVRVGSTVGVAEVTVESETPEGDDEPVAVGQGAYRLFHDG